MGNQATIEAGNWPADYYYDTKQLEAVDYGFALRYLYIYFSCLNRVQLPQLSRCFSNNRRLTVHLRPDTQYFLNVSLKCREICDNPPVTEALHKSTPARYQVCMYLFRFSKNVKADGWDPSGRKGQGAQRSNRVSDNASNRKRSCACKGRYILYPIFWGES